MRKSDREIAGFMELAELLDRCDTIRLGLSDADAPYVVPVSFGYETREGNIVVYFHGAVAGRKFDLLKKHPRVCVEADVCHGFTDSGEGGVTCDFESLIGWGDAVLLEGEEAEYGARLLLEHCGFGGYACGRDAMKRTAVFRIELEEISGKRRFPERRNV